MGKTRGVHETTPEIRNRMVGMYEAGLGLREIAVAVNCSQRTVKRWLNRFDKEGSVETRERCGRKRATTQEQDEAIIRLATQTPITAAKAVLPALGLKCSVDTIRERLHKAGIHNWSPSRKHIQKIPIASSDSPTIQQAVWRSTGTQLGKKKQLKETIKDKSCVQPKKKTSPQKTKSKKIFEDEETPSDSVERSNMHQNFSFANAQQSEQTQPQIKEMEAVPLQSQVTTPLHSVIPSNSSQFSHTLNLIPTQPQPMYHPHPGLDISQNWPLDLVQSSHHYSNNQQNHVHHEQHIMTHVQPHSHLYSHENLQLSHSIESQIHPSINTQNQNFSQQKIDENRKEEHQNLTELSQDNHCESQDIINVCSDVCSNSNCSSVVNSQNSSIDDEVSSDNCSINKKSKGTRCKKKKGGKVKGTLETSVEIRNRMIGMSEAGLSTLSIALAINRSERTVKRWLDRWHKEGNVQTKERKGRKRITTKEQDEAIIAMATQQPLTAAKHVVPALGLKCSVDTIRERLHKAGIHSWKLGKKPGEGNAVHTVHLWQPSGNRSNKVKAGSDKKKKSFNKKRMKNSNSSNKQSNEEKHIQELTSKDTIPTNVVPENNLHFNTPPEAPLVQSSHSISTSMGLLQHQQHTQAPIICSQGPPAPQAVQAMGPMMQQRPDCRLSLSAIVPQIPAQSSTNLPYSSCMMGSSSHIGHIEQSDPINYEPYIWSF